MYFFNDRVFFKPSFERKQRHRFNLDEELIEKETVADLRKEPKLTN